MRTKVIEKNAYPFLEKRTLATARLLEQLVDDIARALLTFHLVYFSRRSVLFDYSYEQHEVTLVIVYIDSL